jgi:hypothetical protein
VTGRQEKELNTRKLVHRATRGLVAASALAVLASPGFTASAIDAKTPATGRVQYRMTGATMNGTMTMAWANHGRRFRQDMKMSIGRDGQQMSMNTWAVADGTHVYMHQPAMGQQVMRMRMPKDAGSAFSLPGIPNPSARGAGKVVGKGTVLGRSCEIRSFGAGGRGQSKVWLWNGMPLKVEASGPQGGMTMIATRVDTTPKLAPSLFKVPSGYQVKEMQLPKGMPGAPPSGQR